MRNLTHHSAQIQSQLDEMESWPRFGDQNVIDNFCWFFPRNLTSIGIGTRCRTSDLLSGLRLVLNSNPCFEPKLVGLRREKFTSIWRPKSERGNLVIFFGNQTDHGFRSRYRTPDSDQPISSCFKTTLPHRGRVEVLRNWYYPFKHCIRLWWRYSFNEQRCSWTVSPLGWGWFKWFASGWDGLGSLWDNIENSEPSLGNYLRELTGFEFIFCRGTKHQSSGNPQKQCSFLRIWLSLKKLNFRYQNFAKKTIWQKIERCA